MSHPAAPEVSSSPVPAAGGAWALQRLQALDAAGFEAALGHAVEHAPWVARRAWSARPFADVAALTAAMRAAILAASPGEQIALLRGHPELAGVEARERRMTADSTSEQGRLGLDRLDAATVARIEALNRRYRERFGYPLVIALRLHADLASVLSAAEQRLSQSPDAELGVALAQVCEVMRGRVQRLVTEPPAATHSPAHAPDAAARASAPTISLSTPAPT